MSKLSTGSLRTHLKGNSVAFNLDEYEPVALRQNRWLENRMGEYLEGKCGHPRTITHMVSVPGADVCVIRAELWLGDVCIATGYAEEVRGAGNVNRTSHVENCETSAVGRALANAGMAGTDVNKRPSREEMQKVQRTSGATVITENGDLASDKQRNMIRAVCKSMGKTPPTNLDGMTKRQASAYIDELKRLEAGEQSAPVYDTPEEPF